MRDYALFFDHTEGAISCKPDLTLEQAYSLFHYWSGYAVRHPDWVAVRIVNEETMETIERRELT
jgi:hypothetical protein